MVVPQTLETIIVFQKEHKYGSMLDDLVAYEQGAKDISVSVWGIDNGRVPTDETKVRYSNANTNLYKGNSFNNSSTICNSNREANEKGRYPSQLFVSEQIADVLDKQSGILVSGDTKVGQSSKSHTNSSFGGSSVDKVVNPTKGDKGGSSKILHKIPEIQEKLDMTKQTLETVMVLQKEHK
jgi:hypothetical protein